MATETRTATRINIVRMKWRYVFLLMFTVSNLVAEPWRMIRWNSTGEQSLRQQQHYLHLQQKNSKQQDQQAIQKRVQQEQKRAQQEQKRWKQEEKKWNQQNTKMF